MLDIRRVLWLRGGGGCGTVCRRPNLDGRWSPEFGRLISKPRRSSCARRALVGLRSACARRLALGVRSSACARRALPHPSHPIGPQGPRLAPGSPAAHCLVLVGGAPFALRRRAPFALRRRAPFALRRRAPFALRRRAPFALRRPSGLRKFTAAQIPATTARPDSGVGKPSRTRRPPATTTRGECQAFVSYG